MEYALLVGLIAAVIAGVVLLLGNSLHGIFSTTNNCISSPSDSTC